MQGLSLLLGVSKEESGGLSCKEVSLAPGAADLRGPQPQGPERDKVGA